MSAVSFAGVAVLTGRIVVPFSGIWHASLVLAQDIPSEGPQTLLVGASPWFGTPVRDILFAGRRGVLVVGGTGGWRTTISAKQYGQGVVPVQAILTDAAAECGELPPVGATGTVPAYCRKGAPWTAGTALNDLLGSGWWVAPTGAVQAYPRATTPIVSQFQAMAVNAAPGIYDIATESPQDWVPGATFVGPTVSGTVSRASCIVEAETFRVEVMVP